jgi:hypothetical protein
MCQQLMLLNSPVSQQTIPPNNLRTGRNSQRVNLACGGEACLPLMTVLHISA